MSQAFNPNAIGQVVPTWAGGGGPGGVLPAGTVVGDMLYWDGVSWVVLQPGVAGQHLETNGLGFAPSWETTPDGQAFINFDLGTAIYPTSAPASPGVATNAPDVPTIDFAQSVDSNVLLAGAMDEKYDGGSLVVAVYYFAETAIAGSVQWEGRFVRQRGGDLVTRAFAAPQSTVFITPGVVDTIGTQSIVYTQVQADSVAPGDPFRLQLRRAGANAADTMLDTARVIAVTLEEP